MANIVLGRGDPPPSAWPGREMTVEDVALASGDERDWFSFQHRLEAFHDVHGMFWSAWRRKRVRANVRNHHLKFGQIMIVGDLGAGKSVLTLTDILPYHAAGHPFFHNGPWLIGRKVEGSSLYDIVGNIPRFSIVAFDETHVSFGSGLTATKGLQAWESDSAGFRKENCRVYMPTAKAVLVAPHIRQNSTEVWRPVKVNVDGRDNPAHYDEELPAHSNRANFIQAWEVWRDYPFQAADIIDSGGLRRDRRSGLGRPDAVYLRNNETVRLGYMLTDSFAPVESTRVRQFALKARMEAQWAQQEAGGEEGSLPMEYQNLVLALGDAVADPDCPEWLSVEALAFDLGMRPGDVRGMMNQLFGNVQGARHPRRSEYNAEVVGIALQYKFDLGDG